jgi:hypothetical protein
MAFELETFGPERLQIRASRAEDHFFAGLLEARAEIGAYCARAHHQDFHCALFIATALQLRRH